MERPRHQEVFHYKRSYNEVLLHIFALTHPRLSRLCRSRHRRPTTAKISDVRAVWDPHRSEPLPRHGRRLPQALVACFGKGSLSSQFGSSWKIPSLPIVVYHADKLFKMTNYFGQEGQLSLINGQDQFCPHSLTIKIHEHMGVLRSSMTKFERQCVSPCHLQQIHDCQDATLMQNSKGGTWNINLWFGSLICTHTAQARRKNN